MRISERFSSVPLIEPADYGSAGIDSDSVNMGRLHALGALFTFGAITGNSILKVYAGATTGAKTTALAFKYRLGAADYKVALADQWGDWTAVAATGLTLTATTFDHRQVAVEINADQVTDGYEWLTFEIDSTATTIFVAALGLGAPRYPGSLIPTAI
jgi:hypothetical protein